jgi:signal transduction histidine kinase
MILVTVGTQSPFDRLVQASDEWARKNPSDKVFAHIGQSQHQPRYMDFADRVSSKAFKDLVGKSELIIAHAGMESILTGLEYSKPVIIVPRLAQYGEHRDDHQLETISKFAHLPQIFAAQPETLSDVINQVRGVHCKCFNLSPSASPGVAEKHLQRMAKMESLSAVAGGAAHDFNNLLSVMGGYAELIRLKRENSIKIDDYATQIELAVNRGKRLTKKLLTFSRKQEAEIKLFELSGFVSGELDLIRGALPNSIELSLVNQSSEFMVSADRGELADALLNLCINASHAMDGRGTISVRLEMDEISQQMSSKLNIASGQYARISVVDNGCGISEETIDQIFEPYFSTKGDQGTGLGLSQVLGMVHRFEGGISVQSTPGAGSTFSLFLPVQ